MYSRTELLLTALKAEKDNFSKVEINRGFVSFFPSESDWETLFRYGLTNRKGVLTNGGKHYQPLPDATHLGTKGLTKGFISMATELNDRIANKGYIPSQEEINILSTLINTINFQRNPLDEANIEAASDFVDYTVDNSVDYGTELEEVKIVEEVVEVKAKKSRKKA